MSDWTWGSIQATNTYPAVGYQQAERSAREQAALWTQAIERMLNESSAFYANIIGKMPDPPRRRWPEQLDLPRGA